MSVGGPPGFRLGGDGGSGVDAGGLLGAKSKVHCPDGGDLRGELVLITDEEGERKGSAGFPGYVGLAM